MYRSTSVFLATDLGCLEIGKYDCGSYFLLHKLTSKGQPAFIGGSQLCHSCRWCLTSPHGTKCRQICHWRVSQVQNFASPVINLILRHRDKIAQNLNADEAAVMGAALYGAARSSQFRTKDIRLTGLTPYSVEMSYQAEEKQGELSQKFNTGCRSLMGLLGLESAALEPRLLTSTIFPSNSKNGVRKTMTFKKLEDFSIHFQYKSTDNPMSGIRSVAITNLTAALANATEADAKNATVKVTIEMSESNLLNVLSAHLFLPEQKEPASVADKIKGFFGSNKDKDANDTILDNLSEKELSDMLGAPKKPAGPVSLLVTTLPVAYLPLVEQEKREAIKRYGFLFPNCLINDRLS